MTTRKSFNWFYIVSFLWGLTGILCIAPSLFFVAFMDQSNRSKFVDDLFIFGALSFPVFSIIMSIVIFILSKNYKKLALLASFLPILPLIPIFLTWTIGSLDNFFTCGAFECKNTSGLPIRTEKHSITIGVCAESTDFSDGLTTTGCEFLDFISIGSGKIDSTSEAHNWKISTLSPYQMKVSINNDGTSCPQINIFDFDGNLINGFPQDNVLVSCSDTNAYPHTYYFTPPAAGNYILRVSMPVKTGGYSIEFK